MAFGFDEEEDEHADDEEEEKEEDFAFGGFALVAGCLFECRSVMSPCDRAWGLE